jgi:hypothetical protein
VAVSGVKPTAATTPNNIVRPRRLRLHAKRFQFPVIFNHHFRRFDVYLFADICYFVSETDLYV